MATAETLPRLRHHKASGRAVVTLSDATTGKRRDFYLGDYGTLDAHSAYAELLARWTARGRTLEHVKPAPVQASPSAGCVAELCRDYAKHIDAKGGISDKHKECIKRAVRITRQWCGALPVAEFGPLALQDVRRAMLAVRFGKNVSKRWNRSTVNRRVRHVVRMFRWAVAHERAPIALPTALACVEPLKVGEFDAPEGQTVKPVPPAHVDDIREYVSSVVWAMVQVQRYSAARAGEVCAMRPMDLDVSGKVWLYRPATHKNAKRGHDRVIYLGSKAQEAIKPLLAGRAVDSRLFDPRESMAERRAANATKGKPRRDGQKPTSTRTPRKVGEQFTTEAYQRAITRACKASGVPHWTTHQLRHLAATNARKEFGAEAALLVLGDKSTRLVDVYAEKDHARAQEVIAKIG
ncbi:MAG: site-specific integrase [Phycisphaeraceae bacterium]|nr:site-specific integrase [Phycisphaeraceae bacterium]